MARGTRKGGFNIFSRLYSPVKHALRAANMSVGAVTNTVKGVSRQGFRGVNRIGNTVTGEMNAAVRGLFRRKTRRQDGGRRRGTRRMCGFRKNRRGTRKN